MSCFSCFRKTNQVYPIVIENEGIDFKNQECMICLSNTESNSVLLPCGHCYHYDCIFKWFEKIYLVLLVSKYFVGKKKFIQELKYLDNF